VTDLADDIIEQCVMHEVAGVVRTPRTLDAVINALTRAGFDQADIDVRADVATIHDSFGQMFIPVEDLADTLGTRRRAFATRNDLAMMRARTLSILFYVGATVAALGVVASGGGLAAALATAAAAGAASGGLGALAMRFLGRERAKLIDTMIMEGGVVLWVRIRSVEAERKAEHIMRDHALDAVRAHEITIDKRLEDLSLSDVRKLSP
jgi:hypothetical protein